MTKKIFSFALIFGLAFTLFAQDGDAGKKMRFGIQVNPQLNWFRSGNVKKYEKDGTKVGFGFGLITEFRLTKNVVFATGIGGSFEGAVMGYNGDTASYVVDADQAFIAIDDINKDPLAVYGSTSNHAYWLKSRSYKTTYITIPITLKMMTNEIGAMKYFALFGGNLGVMTKARAKDEVLDYNANLAQITIEDLNVSKDCVPFRLGLNVGAGAEYNLSGSTSILFGLNYYRSFTTLSKPDSKYLIETYENGKYKALNHKSFADGIALTVGFLF